MQAPDYGHQKVTWGQGIFVGVVVSGFLAILYGIFLHGIPVNQWYTPATELPAPSTAFTPRFVELDCIEFQRLREDWETPSLVWEVVAVGQENYLLAPMPIHRLGYKWGPEGRTLPIVLVDIYFDLAKECGYRTRRGKRR